MSIWGKHVDAWYDAKFGPIDEVPLDPEDLQAQRRRTALLFGVVLIIIGAAVAASDAPAVGVIIAGAGGLLLLVGLIATGVHMGGSAGTAGEAGRRMGSDDVVARLERLQQLHRTGALTEEEFSGLKARLLREKP